MTKKIIFAVLNWGLGHAARSTHIIRELQSLQCHVILASDGPAKVFLEREFPHLTSYKLPLLHIRYPGTHSFWNMGYALLPLLKSIYAEHRAIKNIVQIEKADTIISDNRYGCYTAQTKNIIITHQLNLALPLIFRNPVNYFVRRMLNKFDECWIPDTAQQTLSGELSNGNLSITKRFIGPLSHFTRADTPPSNYKRELIVVLSGPEPQRHYLEENIIQQLKSLSITTLIVQGVPQSKPTYNQLNTDIHIISHLTARDLEREIQSSRYIISRCGYSTIMDLAYLKRSALLIPTPGQPEQLYLARLMKKKGFHHCTFQEHLDIRSDLNKIPSIGTPFSKDEMFPKLSNTLEEWISG